MLNKILPFQSSGLKFSSENSRQFEGYASVFGKVDSYGDTIVPGAYAETIKAANRNGRPIKLRWNHWGPVIGKWLEMAEDDTGLWVKGELTPNHSVASDAAASMLHGAVDGLSIGYMIPEGGSEQDGAIRRLKQINLMEISVVEEPADVFARVSGIKAAVEAAANLKEIEALLRDEGGFSRANATALVSRIKALSDGDRGDESKGISEALAALRQTTNRITGGQNHA